MNVPKPALGVFLFVVGTSLWAVQPANADFVQRRGVVTLQFDDSHKYHYSHIFPILELHGFKGTFAFVTETSDLGIEEGKAWKMQQIYTAGHEIHDHTTRHDYMWATLVDTLDDGVTEWIEYTFADSAIWDSLCDRSLYILDSLGITVTGWNQPGGANVGSIPEHPGWKWASRANDSLFAIIASKYDYAMAEWVVHPYNAHPNLRGHVYPQRCPFFCVPHVMIDYLSLEEIKTGMADAVASGLWYCAVDHAYTMEEVAKIESLAAWLDEMDIDVVRCCEGRDRIQFGHWDPLENQFPQARMLTDLDGNGKPDGFTGECIWDTTSTPPVDSCRCCKIWGETEFICYGPEVGDNSFAMWVRSADSTEASFTVAWAKRGYDWEILETKAISISCSNEWARIDTALYPKFLVHVEDEVDAVAFRVRNLDEGDTVLAALPEFMFDAEAGIDRGVDIPGGFRAPVVVPNPVRLGAPALVSPLGEARVYDVLGREVMHLKAAAYKSEGLIIDTSRLGPGVFLVSPLREGQTAKIVVLK